tara:strand:+ start:66 stop:425 length:360 start_codon:yes stop_codon:yes gene_type:complete
MANTDKDILKKLPEPKGYRLLIAIPKVDEKTEGGIIRAESSRKQEEVATICGLVIKMGPDAYKDSARFPSGPWCKKDDWVIFRPYSGTRVTIFGEEFRIINDDTVEAVVDDPKGVNRAQ